MLVCEPGVYQTLQLGGQLGGLLRNQIEGKGLDGDQAVGLRVMRPENGSQNACANLMQELKPTKSRRRQVGGA
jgi:hypothetical protein